MTSFTFQPSRIVKKQSKSLLLVLDFRILIFILSLGFSQLIYAQQQQENPTQFAQVESPSTPITITVQVSELFEVDYALVNNDTINNHTKIESPGGSANYGDNKATFQTGVSKSQAVKWMIKYEDNADRVDYDLELAIIFQKEGSPTNFFNFQYLLPNNKIILAQPTQGVKDSEYHYFVVFTIRDKHTGIYNTYPIDPILKMQ